MKKEYDGITALHYSAYRPLLHADILKTVISNQSFKLGLDIGCGTGQSSIALSKYCKKVIGIDPSIEMISSGMPHSKVSYEHMAIDSLMFDNDSFDIITYAGSLYYAKSQHLLNETIRVGKVNGHIAVYDFEISLNEVLKKLTIDTSRQKRSYYNHKENFSGLDQSGIQLLEHNQNAHTFGISHSDLGHLLLASKDNFILLEKRFGKEGLYQNIVTNLDSIFDNNLHQLKATTFTSLYLISK